MRTKISPKKINIVSLGCSKNLVDSELLMGQLKAGNLPVTFESDADADIVVINTCGFINDAKEESVDTILQYIRAKEKGLIEKVYVMGCLSERYINELINEIPDVDKYFGVNDISKVVAQLGGDYKKELVGERQLTTPKHYAYLKISEGCNRKCTFCAIPSIRGKHKSRPSEDIISETKKLVAKGVKEIILIAQDLTYYGYDLYGENKFAYLLQSLASIKGVEWIRLHYAYPAGFPLEALNLIKESPNICNYIDLPVQHINNRILSMMQRGHTKKGTVNLLNRIKGILPDVVLRTTLIVGFPGETDKEFNELADFVKEYKFDRLGVFAYSPEEGTKAYDMPDNIPDNIKHARLEKIMAIQQDISLEKNRNRVGRVFKTLIDRKEGEYYIGRTEFDSPEVDNEMIIDPEGKELSIGEFYPVRVSKADFFDLFGKISQF